MNEQPNYILKTVENIRVPKDQKTNTIKTAILIIVTILFIGSIVLGNNLFGELSWGVRIILISLVFGTLFTGNIFKPFPIEIHFYNEHLKIYRKEVYYSRKVKRKEIYDFKYNDIKECKYYPNYQRIIIKGNVHLDWYNYNNDNTIPNIPTISKTGDGLCYFYTSAAPEIDFIKEIEEHSPIKVQIENN